MGGGWAPFRCRSMGFTVVGGVEFYVLNSGARIDVEVDA